MEKSKRYNFQKWGFSSQMLLSYDRKNKTAHNFKADAFNMLKEISVEIGGQEIDKHYSSWLFIWLGLTNTQDKVYWLRK